MVGIVRSAFDKVYSYIPPAGTTDRTLLYLMPFLHFQTGHQNREREGITLAAFSLSGRLVSEDKNPFTQWIKKICPPKIVNAYEKYPSVAPVLSQTVDLCCKVIVSVAFYATRHLSLHDSLTHLLSHSEKASKVAQPILDKMASLPAARFLQSSRVMIFAPVIVKLIQMTLILVDPKGENSVLEPLKTGAKRTSQALEFLWNLRFSLICLGISTTFYKSIVSTLYSLVIYRFVDPFLSNENPFKPLLKWHLFLFSQFKNNHSTTKLDYVLDLLTGGDFWPTLGFSLGLEGALDSLFASADPCDIPTLETLFNNINALTGTLSNLETFDASITTQRLEIKNALNNRKITQNHADLLNELINDRMGECLIEFLNDPNFSAVMGSDDIRALFKKIYCHGCSEDKAEKFINLLNNLTRWGSNGLGTIALEINHILSQIESNDIQIDARKKFLFKKIEKKLQNAVIPLPFAFTGNWSDISEQHSLALILLKPWSHEEAKALRSTIFKQICNDFPPNLIEQDLLDPDKEQALVKIYGRNGYIYRFAVTPEEKYAAYLLSAKFCLTRFNINLGWYLNNSLDDQQKESCELMLLPQASILNHVLIFASPKFKEWLKGTDNKQPPQILLRNYTSESKDFDFARRDLWMIPKGFKFVTYSLPFTIGNDRKGVNAHNTTWVRPNHFLLQFSQELTSQGFIPFSEGWFNQDICKLKSLFETTLGMPKDADPLTFFVSTQTLRNIATGLTIDQRQPE